MSRAALSVQSFSVNGGNITFSAPNGNGAGNGNTIASTGGRCLLFVNNASTTLTPTITVKSCGSPVQGITPPDGSYTVPANAVAYAIWLDPVYYLGAVAGGFAVDISSNVGITWAAVELPQAYQ